MRNLVNLFCHADDFSSMAKSSALRPRRMARVKL